MKSGSGSESWKSDESIGEGPRGRRSVGEDIRLASSDIVDSSDDCSFSP